MSFSYRVALREAGVTYFNRLGRFVGPHELELVDKEGRISNISAARIVIAVGGRPTSLDIPGGEHAINSDDFFMLVSICMPVDSSYLIYLYIINPFGITTSNI